MKKKIELEQHMTSIEIAELTNQNHKDLMKEIKKLEPEWVKLHGNGFILETFKDEQGKTQTCYSLTKPQTLFIARKLAGDAFSTFIIRWIQLNKELEDFVIPNLGSDDEILEKADNIIAEELEELNRDSKYCYTSTEIAKMYNGRMQGNDLISFLVDRKIVRKINGFYELTRKYSNKGYDAYRYSVRYNCHGLRRLKKTLVWTEAGREFLKKLIN